MFLSIKDIYPFHRILIKKYHVRPVLKEIIKLSRGSLIDIGCGEKPFLKYVSHKVDEYIGLDHPDTPHAKENIDIFSTAYNIPFEADHFDVAILTQVIEHLEEPESALTEINRILKKDGVLIIAWPFLYPLHEAPRDFYRYTNFGMTYLAEKSNFTVEKIIPSSGFWITLFGFLSVYLYGKSRLLYILMSPIMLGFFLLCISLNCIDRNKNSKLKWTWNYYCVLKKK